MNIVKKMCALGVSMNSFDEYTGLKRKKIIGFISIILILNVALLADQLQFRIGSYSDEQFVFVVPFAVLAGVVLMLREIFFSNWKNKLFDIMMFVVFTLLQMIFYTTQRDAFSFFIILSIFMIIMSTNTVDFVDMTSIVVTYVLIAPFIIWKFYAINPIISIGLCLVMSIVYYYMFYMVQYRTALVLYLMEEGNVSLEDINKKINRDIIRSQSGLESMAGNRGYITDFFDTDTFLNSENVIFLIFNKDRIFYYNKAFERYYGEELGSGSDIKLHDFIEKKGFYKHYSEENDDDHDFRDNEFVMKKVDGDIRNITGYIQEYSGFQYFIGIDSTEEECERQMLTQKLDLLQRAHDIYSATSDMESIDEMVEYAMLKIKGILPRSNSGSFLKISSDNILTLIASYGVDVNIAKTYRLSLPETYLYEFTQGMLDKAIMVSMVENPVEYEYFFRAPNNRKTINDSRLATIAVPLNVKGEFYGCFNFDTSSLDLFSRRDLENVNYLISELEKAIAIGSHEVNSRMLSNHDSLTGLLNKRSIDEVFNALKEQSSSIIFTLLKLPHIKEINEKYTFKNGDKYILKFVDKLALVFDESAHMARYSGNELIILEANLGKNDISERLEVLKVLLDNDPMEIGGGESLTVKFDYAAMKFPDEGVSVKTLYEAAVDMLED